MDKDAIIERLIDISNDVTEVKTMLKNFQGTLDAHVAEDKVLHTAQDGKITKVQETVNRQKWFVAGASAVISGLVTGASIFLGLKR